MVSETLDPSDARTVGLSSTLVLLSVIIMLSSAPGSDAEKSLVEMWLKPFSATAVVPVVLELLSWCRQWRWSWSCQSCRWFPWFH